MTNHVPRRALIEEPDASLTPRHAARSADPQTAAAAPTTDPSATGATPSGDYLSHKQILVVMGGLMAGMFLAALDQSIVGVALPKITSDLGGLDKLSWVVTAYLLTSTAATPLWARSPTCSVGGRSSSRRSWSSWSARSSAASPPRSRVG